MNHPLNPNLRLFVPLALRASADPLLPGIHEIDLTVTAQMKSGTPIERTISLTVEAQAGTQPLMLDTTRPAC